MEWEMVAWGAEAIARLKQGLKALALSMVKYAAVWGAAGPAGALDGKPSS